MNKDVRRYVEAAPKDRTGRKLTDGREARRLFDKLQAMILDLYPQAEVVISYQIPTYKAKSGWVALGYWSGGVSLYTNGPHHIEDFKAQYPAIKTGKGSINFRVSDPVPVTALKRVIRHAIEHPKAP
jgi:uncharacterized protein YdhG (YjbR/CyaY superfamily)